MKCTLWKPKLHDHKKLDITFPGKFSEVEPLRFAHSVLVQTHCVPESCLHLLKLYFTSDLNGTVLSDGHVAMSDKQRKCHSIALKRWYQRPLFFLTTTCGQCLVTHSASGYSNFQLILLPATSYFCSVMAIIVICKTTNKILYLFYTTWSVAWNSKWYQHLSYSVFHLKKEKLTSQIK